MSPFIILIVLALLVAATMFGYWCGTSDYRAKCFKAGVGKWVLDPETGEKKFKLGNNLTP